MRIITRFAPLLLLPHFPVVDLKRPFDLELYNLKDNVKTDCLLQLKLSQPILKADLYEYQGEISNDAKEELMVLLEDFYGLTYDEES